MWGRMCILFNKQLKKINRYVGTAIAFSTFLVLLFSVSATTLNAEAFSSIQPSDLERPVSFDRLQTEDSGEGWTFTNNSGSYVAGATDQIQVTGSGIDWSAQFWRSDGTAFGSGNKVSFDFYVDVEQSKSHLSITKVGGTYERLAILDNGGRLLVQFYRPSDPQRAIYHQLLSASDFEANTWYSGSITVDDQYGFLVEVEQRDNPAVKGFYRDTDGLLTTGSNWKFFGLVYENSVFVENYAEQAVTLSPPTADDWTFTNNSGSYVAGSVDQIQVTGTETDWSAQFWRKDGSNFGSGNKVSFDFYVDEKLSKNHMSITKLGGSYERLAILDNGGGLLVQVYRPDEPQRAIYYPLLPASDFAANTWYRGSITVDDQNGFLVEVEQRDNPNIQGSYRDTAGLLTTGSNWKFFGLIFENTVFVENYLEEPAELTPPTADEWTFANGSGSYVAGSTEQIQVTGTETDWSSQFWRKDGSNFGSGNKVSFDFYVDEKLSKSHMSITKLGGSYERLAILDNGGGLLVQVYRPSDPQRAIYYPLLPASEFQANTWYRGSITVDDINGFLVEVEQRDNPSINGSFRESAGLLTTGSNWRFFGLIFENNVFVENYLEEADISSTPTPTVEPSPTATSTVTPTVEPSPTATSTLTPTVEPSPTATSTLTPTVEPSPTATSTLTPTVEPNPTATSTLTPTVEPSPTATSTLTPTVEPSPTTTSTLTPTVEPTPTATSTVTPTVEPSPTATSTSTPLPPPVADYSGTLLNHLDISFTNPTWSGNPFDLVATVTFTHSTSGTQRQTEMFYNGGDEWKARFTAEEIGLWSFSTSSSDSDLDGLSGTIGISTSDALGFVVPNGDKWTRSGTGKAFVPQFVMFADPDIFHDDQPYVQAGVDNFIGDHGFTGFHLEVYCRWFDIDQDSCNNINEADPNPDMQTFEAIELLIAETYAAGGTVHLWAWGDTFRGQNPLKWGYNGAVDQRLQRYIAARLGPIPGWSMGYGFDLWEWTNQTELDTWHAYMHGHMGWPHMLGARAQKNQIAQISEALDYSAYEQHHPDYDKYVETIEDRAYKPSFSEDRFRITVENASKDYSFEETRRGMWHSGMAGGVANIWGYLLQGGTSYRVGSADYPNKDELKLYSSFFAEHFTQTLERCNGLTDGVCLKEPTNDKFLFYKEDTASIEIDFTSMGSTQPFVAVNTITGVEITGTFQPQLQTWTAPDTSDWAIVVGD